MVPGAAGAALTYGASSVLLVGQFGLPPSDIVAGGRIATGGAGGDTIDQSAATRPVTADGLAGADIIRGGGADDWITGGASADDLTGGAGRDSFVFATGSGADIIRDFVPGLDKIVLRGVDPASLTANWYGSSGIQLHFGSAGDTIALPDITALVKGSIVLA